MREVLLMLQDHIHRLGGAYGVYDRELLSSALPIPSTWFEESSERERVTIEEDEPLKALSI
jgi:hypothetical protein